MQGRALIRDRMFNFLLFQGGWLLTVGMAAAGRPLAAALGGGGVLAVHLLLTRQRAREGGLVCMAMLLGVLLDTLLVGLGALVFPGAAGPFFLPPPWMVVLWGLFAATLSFSLSWLKHRPLTAILFGAAGGPLAYLAGVRLGAAELGTDAAASLAAIGLVWAVAMALLIPIVRRLVPVERGYRLFAER